MPFAVWISKVVFWFIAPGGAKKTRNETWYSVTMYQDAVVREPVRECHPLAMITCHESRQAKVNARPRSSPRSTRPLQTSHVVIHIPGGPRATVITTEASASTLWIQRECAAVVVFFLFALSLLDLRRLTFTCTGVSMWLKKKCSLWLCGTHKCFMVSTILKPLSAQMFCFANRLEYVSLSVIAGVLQALTPLEDTADELGWRKGGGGPLASSTNSNSQNKERKKEKQRKMKK